MSHHFESLRAYSIDDPPAFLEVGDLEFLLEEDGRLLIRGFDDAGHEDVVWRRRGGVQEREEVDGLGEKSESRRI